MSSNFMINILETEDVQKCDLVSNPQFNAQVHFTIKTAKSCKNKKFDTT